jgi:predicted Zn-dependent protease
MGEVYLRAGRWADADRQFTKASEFAPHWPLMNRQWAIALTKLRRTKDAQEKLKIAASNE